MTDEIQPIAPMNNSNNSVAKTCDVLDKEADEPMVIVHKNLEPFRVIMQLSCKPSIAEIDFVPLKKRVVINQTKFVDSLPSDVRREIAAITTFPIAKEQIAEYVSYKINKALEKEKNYE
jgi:hypothetical protein